eukprot:scaffold25754_cov104-Isochrysis_galbana.AAC.2
MGTSSSLNPTNTIPSGRLVVMVNHRRRWPKATWLRRRFCFQRRLARHRRAVLRAQRGSPRKPTAVRWPCVRNPLALSGKLGCGTRRDISGRKGQAQSLPCFERPDETHIWPDAWARAPQQADGGGSGQPQPPDQVRRSGRRRARDAGAAVHVHHPPLPPSSVDETDNTAETVCHVLGGGFAVVDAQVVVADDEGREAALLGRHNRDDVRDLSMAQGRAVVIERRPPADPQPRSHEVHQLQLG